MFNCYKFALIIFLIVLIVCRYTCSNLIFHLYRMRHVSWTTRRWLKKIIARSYQATGKQNRGSWSGKKSKNDWRRLVLS